MNSKPGPAVPDPGERTRLNRAFLRHGWETGFYDEDGVPAPWPEDIDHWRPVTNDSVQRLTSGQYPF